MPSLNVSGFKSLLFANQKLEDLPIETEIRALRTSTGIWRQLGNAQSLLAQNSDEAIECLRDVCASHEAATRPKLWAWFNLRRFGILPDVSDSDIVRGVVLEVRVSGGIDVLAAYEDNSARYLNYSGKLIAWDLSDREIDALCKNLLTVANQAMEFSVKDYGESPQINLLRVTLLTFDGSLRIEGDPNTSTVASPTLGQLFTSGAMLMNALINRSKAMTELVRSQPR